MQQVLYLDPRIRDYVFIPLVLMMLMVSVLRFYIQTLMNSQVNKLLKDQCISRLTLKGTPVEKEGSLSKDLKENFDLLKTLDEIKDDIKDNNALARSDRIRTTMNYLPEESIKNRMAFFCKENGGYFNKSVTNNPLAAMMNPDMMSGMLKNNVQGMFNIALFSVVGNLFSGFIIARVPFPLGHKFKSVLQQGLKLNALDPTYVSSMSWTFLLIFGLQGIMSLILGDTGIDEMMMFPGGQQMMNQDPMGQKDYNKIFASEKKNYEILDYQFQLQNVEEAYLQKCRKQRI